MYDACDALRDTMIQLGVAIDGGKDSLSMAARAGVKLSKRPGLWSCLLCHRSGRDQMCLVTPSCQVLVN